MGENPSNPIRYNENHVSNIYSLKTSCFLLFILYIMLSLMYSCLKQTVAIVTVTHIIIIIESINRGTICSMEFNVLTM